MYKVFSTIPVAKCISKIKSTIATIKSAFNKNSLCISKLELNFGKRLVKCYIWSIALYGAETWTLQKVDQKCLVSLKWDAAEGWKRPVARIV